MLNNFVKSYCVGSGKSFLSEWIFYELNTNYLDILHPLHKDKIMDLESDNLMRAFQIAKENAPCFIFIDNIDSLNDEFMKKLAMFLNEFLDIPTIATSNQPWRLCK